MHHVVRSHPRGQQRLVRVPHRRVGNQQPLLIAYPFRESLGTEFLECVPRALREADRFRGRELADGHHVERHFALAHAEIGTRLVLHFRMPVDDDIRDVREQLRRAILPVLEHEQLGRFVEKLRRYRAIEELWVRD